jgi:hypothetical protein
MIFPLPLLKDRNYGYSVLDASNFTEGKHNDTIDKEIADVAQLVEQLIRNQQVIGSSPIVGSIHRRAPRFPTD